MKTAESNSHVGDALMIDSTPALRMATSNPGTSKLPLAKLSSAMCLKSLVESTLEPSRRITRSLSLVTILAQSTFSR